MCCASVFIITPNKDLRACGNHKDSKQAWHSAPSRRSAWQQLVVTRFLVLPRRLLSSSSLAFLNFPSVPSSRPFLVFSPPRSHLPAPAFFLLVSLPPPRLLLVSSPPHSHAPAFCRLPPCLLSFTPSPLHHRKIIWCWRGMLYFMNYGRKILPLL